MSARSLRQGADSCEVKVEIGDSGIDPTALDQIFTAFPRRTVPIRAVSAAGGLGLAITRALVEAMDGKIVVNSVKGQGTTFQYSVRLGLASTQA